MNTQSFNLKKLLLSIGVLFVFSVSAFSQGKMFKEDDHYIAALDFFNNYSAQTKGRITNVNPQKSFVIPNWSENVHASELIQRAILVVDWWSLFGEPTENYNFQWISSGHYSIIPDDKNHPVTIFRKDLVDYPDLLKRFDALKPLDIHFEIYWSLKDGIGKVGYGEGMPNMSKKSTFKTEIKNGLLFETSAKRPLSVPSIRKGKGHEFLGLPTNLLGTSLSENDFKTIMNDFSNMKYDIEFTSFGITHIKLPIAEMKAIAQLYDDYKSGKKEPSPMEQVADADKENANLSAYGKNDFWGEAENIKDIETVTIGSQKWTKNNIDVTTFMNGDPIAFANDNAEWISLNNSKTPAYAFPFFDKSRAADGLIYNYYAVVDSRKLLPLGFRVANSNDWADLKNLLESSKINIENYFGAIKGGGVVYVVGDKAIHTGGTSCIDNGGWTDYYHETIKYRVPCHCVENNKNLKRSCSNYLTLEYSVTFYKHGVPAYWIGESTIQNPKIVHFLDSKLQINPQIGSGGINSGYGFFLRGVKVN